jgi:hypothetical protein
MRPVESALHGPGPSDSTRTDHLTEEPRVTVPDDIKPGDHLCVLYRGQRERDRVLLPYLRGGIRAGDKCLFATSDTDANDILADLGDDTEMPAAVRSGQLEVRAAASRSKPPAELAISRLIKLWDSRTSAALDDGYGFARLSAEARWWMPPAPDTEAFQRYETELNRYLPTHPQTALCLYDMSYFDGSVVVDVVKFHPVVMFNGLVLENPYHLNALTGDGR